MKNYIHINTSCPCAVSVNGHYTGRADIDGFIHLCVESGESLLISATPTDAAGNAEKVLPCAATVAVNGSLVTCKSRAVALTSFPKNHYELTITPERVYGFAPACTIKQIKFNYRGETHTASVVRDTMSRLVCEGAGQIYTHVLPQSFSLTDLSADTSGQAALIKVFGAAGKDGMTGEYAAVIIYDGAYNLNLNLLADKIESEGKNIQTLTSLCDIARRGVVTTYKAGSDNYELDGSYAVYVLNAALRPAHETLVPFAFFQAIKAGDFPEARYFLSDTLNTEIESDGALSAFFQDFDVMDENKYYPELSDCVILKSHNREKNAAKLLQYKLDGGKKIDNIKIL